MTDPANNHPHVDPNANSPVARLYNILLNSPHFPCPSNVAAPASSSSAPADPPCLHVNVALFGSHGPSSYPSSSPSSAQPVTAAAATTTTTTTESGPSAPHNTSPPHKPPTTANAKVDNNDNPPPPSGSSGGGGGGGGGSLNPFTRHRRRRAAEKRREREERREADEKNRRKALWRGNSELRRALTDRVLHAPDESPEERARWPAGLPEATRLLLRFVDALDEVVPKLPVRGGTGEEGVWGVEEREERKEVAVWMKAGAGKKVVRGGEGGAEMRSDPKSASAGEKEEEAATMRMGRLRGGGGNALSSTTSSSISEYSQRDVPPYDPGNNDNDNNASSATAESSSASHQQQCQHQQQKQRTSHTTTSSSSPFPLPPNPSPPLFPKLHSQTTTIKPPHSTIFPLRIFPLPIPDRLKDSMLVQLPRSFCRQVHAKVTMTENESGKRPTSPTTTKTTPLWSECFGAMRPKAVAVRGKRYEERKGVRFRGPYWVKDAEGRVKAVEDEGERRGLMRRWFGDDEEEAEEVSDGEQAKRRDRGKFRGSGGDGDGDDGDDEQPVVMGKLRGGGMGHVYEPGARSELKVYRDDHYDWRIFRTPPLPHPVDEYDEWPRWLRCRRKHSTIVPIPDWMLDDSELNADAYMGLEYGPEKLGISGTFGPPKLEIKGPSEPWEVVFPSWTPQELAGLQRGWEECRYGRYDGPYWKSDEKGKVRVVDTRQERDRLMEEWFIEGKGKWRGSLSRKQEAKLKDHPETRQTGHLLSLRGGGHFDDADDEYSGGEETSADARDGWSSDGYQPLGSGGETMRSLRSWSSSCESAESNRPFAYPNPQARGSSSNADAEAEARGLFEDSSSGSSTFYDVDSDSGSSTYSDEDSDSESSTDYDEDYDGDSSFYCSGNFNRNTRIYIDEDSFDGPCHIYIIKRLDESITRNNDEEIDGNPGCYYYYYLYGTFNRGTGARIERGLNGRYSLYIEEPTTRNNDNTSIARAFRRSLQAHPGRLPSVIALWRDYYWAWPQAWYADGSFNWELWGQLLRQLTRVRRERARLWRRWQRRERRERRGGGGGGASGGGRDSRRPDDDVDVESNHHRRSENGNGSDSGNATLPSDLYWSDSSEEDDDGNGEEKSPGLSGTTAAASTDSGSERKSSEASGEEHGKRRGSEGGSGSGSGSGSDWEAYWGNLAGKRIPTDENDADDAEEPRASERRGRGGRLDRKAERVEAERRRREKDDVARRERAAERRRPDDDDEEKGYDSAASGECREMIRQLCTEGQPPHEIRLQTYLHYLDNDTWRGEEGREGFGYRMLEILDEEIGLAEAGEQQTISTGSENTVKAWQNKNNDEVGRLRGGSGSNADGGGTSDGDEEPPVSNTRPDEAGEQGGVHGGDGVDQESSDALNFWMFWFVFGDTGR